MCVSAALIGGASLLGAGASIIGGNKAAKAQSSAANTAAGAQVEAARIASDTQRQMFDQTRADAQPFMGAGQNALAALQFELGLGARPLVGNTADAFNPAFYLANNPDVAASGYGVSPDMARQHFEIHGRSEGRAGNQNVQTYGGFQETPGYAFARDQGTRAIDASAASRGMLRSGATLKAQEQFGQGIAAQEYGNYINRLMGISGTGQSTTGQIGALGTSVGGQIGNNALMAGQGSANAAMAGGAARASAYQNMGNAVNNLAGNALGAAAFGGYLSPGGGFGNSSAGRFSNALY